MPMMVIIELLLLIIVIKITNGLVQVVAELVGLVVALVKKTLGSLQFMNHKAQLHIKKLILFCQVGTVQQLL